MRYNGCKFVELAVSFFQLLNIISQLYIFLAQFVARLCDTLDDNVSSAFKVINLCGYEKNSEHTGDKKILVQQFFICTYKNIADPVCLQGDEIKINEMRHRQVCNQLSAFASQQHKSTQHQSSQVKHS